MSLFLTISVSISLSLLLQENLRCRKSSFKVATDKKPPLCSGGRKSPERPQMSQSAHEPTFTSTCPQKDEMDTKWIFPSSYLWDFQQTSHNYQQGSPQQPDSSAISSSADKALLRLSVFTGKMSADFQTSEPSLSCKNSNILFLMTTAEYCKQEAAVHWQHYYTYFKLTSVNNASETLLHQVLLHDTATLSAQCGRAKLFAATQLKL